MQGSRPPSPIRSPSHATSRAPIPSAADRVPPPRVPPGRPAPLHRRPHRGGPQGGPPGDQGPLDRPHLHATGDPLGLPRPGPRRRPVLSRRGRPADRASRRGEEALQLRDRRLLPGAGATPERFFAAVARTVGRRLDERVDPMDLEGAPRLPVRRLDGLHARHAGEPGGVPPDLQPDAGHVLPRRAIGPIISLSCGAILDLGICRYAGKGQGEVSLLRRMWDVLRPAMSCWGTA